MEAPQRAITLMFSGGIDSTMAALNLARQYGRVHLVTYQNGYGHLHVDRTRRRVDELRRHAGDRFEHTVLSTQALFDTLLVDRVLEEFRKHRSAFVWCLGCKTAMHTRSICYNLEHGITAMADGSSRSTGEMVEQSLLSLSIFRELYASFGIDFRTPVYTIPRQEEVAALKAMGVKTGLRVLDRFVGHQPSCRAGELYYLPFLLFDQPPKHDPEAVSGFLDERTEMARALVRAWCEQRGIALPGAA